MTIQFKEGTKYKLQADYYESILLECTYVEDNTVWFSVVKSYAVARQPYDDAYKLDRKTNKLYKLNNACASWDSIENTLSEYTAEDAWSKRTGNDYYSGIGQD
jgi:hypothetical protein